VVLDLYTLGREKSLSGIRYQTALTNAQGRTFFADKQDAVNELDQLRRYFDRFAKFGDVKFHSVVLNKVSLLIYSILCDKYTGGSNSLREET
jgi:hypothetical protein